jgi:hypothetical protein
MDDETGNSGTCQLVDCLCTVLQGLVLKSLHHILDILLINIQEA